jgi:hypothetical protein
MSEAFNEAAHEMARRIREGGNVGDYSGEVHRSNWNSLAAINEAGFLTFDSQDTLHYEDGTPQSHKRAFVLGFMSKYRATRFVENFNICQNKIAVVVSVTTDYHSSHVPVTSQLSSPNYWIPRHSISLSWPEKSIIGIKQEVGLTETEPVAMVVVMNADWGVVDNIYSSIMETLEVV